MTILGRFFFAMTFGWALWASADFKAPPLTGPVIDEPGLLRTSDRRDLEQVLRRVNDSGLAQFQVAILESLDGLTIEEASIQLFDQWRLGKTGKDNGILFLISNNDRRMRFEIGRGLEGTIPDIKAKQILADQVVPLFRAGRPSAGIVVGVSEVLRLLQGDASADGTTIAPEESSRADVWMFFGFLILIFVLQIVRGLTGGFGRGSRGVWRDPWGGGGGGGFGGGGWGGGGGGWSGGGGSSAGGGASSGW